MDNPLSLMYSWQAVSVAIAGVGITKLVKTIIDTVLRSKARNMAAEDKAKVEKLAAKMGYRDQARPQKAKSEAHYYALLMRKNSVWMNRFVLPLTPIIVGVLVAAFVPVHPETLIEYLDENVSDWWGRTSVFALWGGACGQFADYIFSKVKAFFEDFARKNKKKAEDDEDLPEGAEVSE